MTIAADTPFQRLIERARDVPPQHSAAWYAARKVAANSSEYGTYCSRYRVDRLRAIAEDRQSVANHVTAWGTHLEVVSNYLFAKVTGYELHEAGSLSHPLYPSIRGSVDGFGEDERGELFILETKTPHSDPPQPCHSSPRECEPYAAKNRSVPYLYQMIQNVEITDASYALFNRVVLLPCTTDDLFAHHCAHDTIRSNEMRRVRYEKFGRATELPITAVATMVIFRDASISERHTTSSGRDRHATNLFDALNARDGVKTLRWLFTHDALRFIPIGYTTSPHLWSWSSQMAMMAMERGADAFAFFKLDSHLIERVDRHALFWRETVVPIALQWIEDLHRAKNDGEVIDREVNGLPLPPGVTV